MRLFPRDLPCGCQTCGCLCEAHSASGEADLCARHALPVIARWLLGEVLALGAVILLIACAGVWGVVLRGPGPFG